MQPKHLTGLARYLWNVDLEHFARDIYQKPSSDYYVSDKFQLMLKSPLLWIGELDSQHLQRLTDAVNKYNEEN